MTSSENLSFAFSADQFGVYEAEDGATLVFVEYNFDAWFRLDTIFKLRL